MNVTIEQAIEEITELQSALKEGGFLHECLNMAKGALKTIQDGNFQINTCNVPRETLVKMAEYDCRGVSCGECKYWAEDSDGYRVCFALKAKDILRNEQHVKEVEAWIKQNAKNL